MISKREIFEKSHLGESSELCRKYFKEQGLQLDNFYPKSDYYRLAEFIDEEIVPLLADKSYSMIKRLRTHREIKFNKDGVYLFANGYYFDKREAITFNLRTKFIGFCGWASGCNKTPFIRGFIKWCDYLNSQSIRRDELRRKNGSRI